MTLPGSGAISFANIDAEIANGTNSIDMNWVRTNTKDSVTNLGALYNRAWYQSNNQGNCNNGNCASANCNCTGNIQCNNCTLVAINCANCDTRAWLQPNCNCACTYNCTQSTNITYNCNCTCFVAGCRVLMADLSWKAIETVRKGELAMGPKGPVLIEEVDVVTLGPQRALLTFEDDPHGNLVWSDEHTMWVRTAAGDEWLWSYNPDHWRQEVGVGAIGGLKDNHSLLTGPDVQYAHVLEGFVSRTVREHSRPDSALPLYLPRTNGSPIIVEGYVVGAGINEAAFDYSQIEWLKDYLPIKQALENRQ